ncbi:MAG TPA: hypothetical protein VMV26_15905 [Alphaproteobacteria bacterium]|nr:hypothetical protein [Alphaproteobacteria bacterium]
MADTGSRADLARRKAQEKFAEVKQRDAEARRNRDKAAAAAIAKTERLKALRLAKEAEDRAAAAAAPAKKPPRRKAPSEA